MSKKYYASESAHGTASSYGFCNDTEVTVWDSKKNRDNYVAESSNISCKAIKRTDVTREATNENLAGGGNNAPVPFDNLPRRWCIILDLWDRHQDQEGFIGVIDVCESDETDVIETFYK